MSATSDATASLVAYQQGRTVNVRNLALLLGCHIRVNGTRTMPYSKYAEIPETVVTQLLLGAMRTDAVREASEHNAYDGLSILNGLSKNERWRGALTSTSDAYKFTALLSSYLDTMDNFRPSHHGDALHAAMGPAIQDVLYAWAGANLDVDRNFSSDMLARVLFGDAWCDFSIDGVVGYWEVKDLISTHRPPFRAGLVSGQTDTLAQELPPIFDATCLDRC